MLLPALMCLVSCTDSDDFSQVQRELTLSATMPGDKVITRVGLETQYNSKNLSSKWQETDDVQIIITQEDNKYEIGMVRVSNISDDSKRADITFKLPETLNIEQPYTIYAFTGIEGKVEKGDNGAWQPTCTAELQRTWLRFFVDVPLFCKEVIYNSNDTQPLRFEHFGTYEVLHMTNKTSSLISFKQDGFENEGEKWYWKRANINLENGTISSGIYGDNDNSQGQNIHAGLTDEFISWYLPSGEKLQKARLKATINNRQVTSVNTKSSEVNIKRGNVYHLYATWNGQELTFDNGDFVESRTYALNCEEIDFKEVKVGESKTDYFMITNTGNVPLTFTVEATHGEFEIDGSGTPFQLDPSASKVFIVKFKPEQYNKNYQKAVNITCEDAEGPQHILLRGQSEKQEEETRTYTVTPEEIDFGSVSVGETLFKSFVIKNTGNVALTFFIESTHGEFDIQRSAELFEIKPNATATIEVTFKPESYNTPYYKEVRLLCYDSQGPKVIILKGQTRVQETKTYTVTPLEIDFGSTDVGETKESAFTIQNTGNVALTLAIQSTHGVFEISKSGSSIQLSPNQSETFSVTFTPEEFDTSYQKVVNILSDDADGPNAITLKGHTETRIDQVIPPDIRETVEEHITIYDGVNPPNVEGEYIISPMELTYDSEYNYSVGHVFSDTYIKLHNQNTHNNTIDYQEKQMNNEQIGDGAFISGEGNNFSIYFNTFGIGHEEEYDINYKTALVISGTITSDGIKNLEYAFVMTEKSSDPRPYYIPVGAFRSFKDGNGFSDRTAWSNSVKAMKWNVSQKDKHLPKVVDVAPRK